MIKKSFIKKKILFILATHGDEYFSIDVFNKIEKKFSKEKYSYDWVIGNERALKRKVRFTQIDLNRSAPGDLNSQNYEERRAFELLKLADKYEYVIDVHGTVSNTGIFTIVPKPCVKNILFTAIMPIKKNVFWYSKNSIKGPLTQFCKAATAEIECGPKTNPEIALKLENIIIQILKNLNNPNYSLLFESLSDKEYYSVYGSEKKNIRGLKDFKKVKVENEEFYPLFLKQYKDVAYYKAKKINFEELLGLFNGY